MGAHMNGEHRSFLALPECLASLRDKPRWVGWKWTRRLDKKTGKIKLTKPPFQANGKFAENNDPETWTTLAEIEGAMSSRRFDGVGLQLLGLNGMAALDLDDVRNPDTGEVLAWAKELIACGTYAEATPSGTGFRVIGRVAKDYPPRHAKRKHPGGGVVEFYVNTDTGRYITVSGHRVDEAPDAAVRIDEHITRLWAKVNEPGDESGDESDQSDQSDQSEGHAENGFDFDPGDFEVLPKWVRTCIEHGSSGDRSADFQSAVNALQGRGWTFEDALKLFERHPNGPAGKYAGRLEQELRRSWAKAESTSQANENSAEAEAPGTSLRWSNIRVWDLLPPPDREWSVRDVAPIRQVGLLSGEGGGGKSIIEMTRNAAHACGREWMGKMPEQGPAFYVGAEDEEDEIHRRYADIAGHYGVSFADLASGGLHVLPLLGEDATLCRPARKSGIIETTPLFRQLLEAAGDIKPKNISIDTLSRAYAGSEIDRPSVYQFAAHMQKLAMAANGSVTVLAHPSLAGMANGSGLSGSTAWHGAFRFRMYLKSVKADGTEDDGPDSDLRELAFRKNQYGPLGQSLILRYQNGLFLPEPGATSLDRAARGMTAERVFLELLRRFTAEGRNVTTATGSYYAPSCFEKETEAKEVRLKSRELADAMRSLFKAGKIGMETYGKGSRPHSRIVPL